MLITRKRIKSWWSNFGWRETRRIGWATFGDHKIDSSDRIPSCWDPNSSNQCNNISKIHISLRYPKLTGKNREIFNLLYNDHVFPFVTKQLLIKMIVLHPWFMPGFKSRHTGFTNMYRKPSVCLCCFSKDYCGPGSHDCFGATILWKSHF